jgi:hypothetical protein
MFLCSKAGESTSMSGCPFRICFAKDQANTNYKKLAPEQANPHNNFRFVDIPDQTYLKHNHPLGNTEG